MNKVKYSTSKVKHEQLINLNCMSHIEFNDRVLLKINRT